MVALRDDKMDVSRGMAMAANFKVLNGNIQIAVFPAAMFQKLQQPPADLSTLFHGLVFVEGQCKVGVIPSGQAIAVKRTAEIIAPEKEVPLTAPESLSTRLFSRSCCVAP